MHASVIETCIIFYSLPMQASNRLLTLAQPSLILGEQDWERESLLIWVSGLIQLLTEGRLSHARGPARIYRVCYISTLLYRLW